jgi:hypothetical protein
VGAVPVPRELWEPLFRSQGMRNPGPRLRMLDGFNEAWIEFRDGGRHAIKGRTNALAVIAALVASTEAQVDQLQFHAPAPEPSARIL